MSKARTCIGFAILVGLVVLVCWRQQIISKLRADIVALRSEIKLRESWGGQNNASATAAANGKEMETVRKEHAELLRLRGEITRLNQQVKASQGESVTSAAPIPLALPANDDYRILTNVTAELKNNETMIIEGWDATEGKKTYALVTSQFTDSNQITITPRYVEVPLDKNTREMNDQFQSERLSSSDTRRLLQKFEHDDGVVVLRGAPVTTLNGKQIQISSMEGVDESGGSIEKSLDLIPTIAADGSSVSISIFIQSAPKKK